MNLLDTFDKEIELEFQGERYLVRDNGSVLRKNQYHKKARTNDNKGSFGVANASSGYMFLSGVLNQHPYLKLILLPVYRLIVRLRSLTPLMPWALISVQLGVINEKPTTKD